MKEPEAGRLVAVSAAIACHGLAYEPALFLSCYCGNIFCKLGAPGACRYQYAVCKMMGSWILVSRGPDRIDDWAETMWMCPMRSTYPPIYDPTNGTISYGDIWRLSKQ